MPTLNIYVATTPRKIDKKFEVSIRITQHKKHAYLETGFYVVKQQLTKDRKIKDPDVQLVVLKKKKKCEDILLEGLGDSISSYTAKELKTYLKKKLNTTNSIGFIDFARNYIANLIQLGELDKENPLDRNKKLKRAKKIQSAINAFQDKFGSSLDIRELKTEKLKEFENYLRKERTIIRKNQFGDEVHTKRKPLSDTGIHDYMVDLKLLFSEAKKKYNDPDCGIILISNDPFMKYKIPKPATPQNRYADIDFIKNIIKSNPSGIREKLGRDMYLLSFLLIGVNSVDIYEMKPECLKNGRLTYNRSKTEDRREDKALISVKVEPEAMEIIKKYLDPLEERLFSFHRMYADADGFNAAINKGLKKIREDINRKIDKEIEQTPQPEKKKQLENGKLQNTLTYYSARHGWASIVRNRLGYSKHIVGECLNHLVDSLKITDRYIEKEFTWMDEINRKVIDLVFEKNSLSK